MADGIAVLRLVRHPMGITAIIVACLAVVIWMDQTQKRHTSPGDTADAGAESLLSSPPAGEAAPTRNGELPAIVKRFGAEPQTPGKTSSGAEKAPALGLANLLTGLESKVKADPANISNRILLAQTYQELGLRDKALAEARGVAEKDPTLPRARLVLASILSTSKEPSELKEAVTLLEGLRSQADVKQFLVQMYLGDVSIRLGDHQGAITNWKAALENMPATDNRREDLQKRIAELDNNA